MTTNGPIRWPGAKNKALPFILPKLPSDKIFVDVFGGSGAILINMPPSKLEVYNDIHRGLVSFYRCLIDIDLCRQLCELIEWSIHSRSEFDRLKLERETTNNIVKRAFAWYYTISYSFSGKGENFGRSTSAAGRMVNIRENIPKLYHIHRRLARVQVEELDFRKLVDDYEGPNTVFYCDPPYLDKDYYGNPDIFGLEDHLDLINLAQTAHGFFAISGYPTDCYNDFKWDEVLQWDQATHMQGTLTTGLKRGSVTEMLWIKDNR